MKRFLILLLVGSWLQSLAQNLNPNIRDRFQRITVVDNDGSTRGATCFIPLGWRIDDPHSLLCAAFIGNGGSGSWADSTLDAPGRLVSTKNKNGRWNGTWVRYDGDTNKVAFIQIPDAGSSTLDAQQWDSMLALWAKFLKQIGYDSTTVADERLIGVKLSGGPDRFIDCKILVSDTANVFLHKVNRGVFMSPTYTANGTTMNPHFKYGKWWVWFALDDTNTGTPKAAAYSLYTKLSITNEKHIDSLATGGHSYKTWDSIMNTSNFRMWRWLADDFEVAAPNQLPQVNAGEDITTSSSSVTLNGIALDSDGSIASVQWTQISGTAATIATPTNDTTAVSGLTNGVYQFQLQATDNEGGVAKDTIQVTLQANTPPISNAGPDQTLTLVANSTTTSVTLDGTGSSDPDGTITSYLWQNVSGIGEKIQSPYSAVTQVTNLSAGLYKFKLTVTDNSGATNVNTMEVIVNAPDVTFTTVKGRKPRN